MKAEETQYTTPDARKKELHHQQSPPESPLDLYFVRADGSVVIPPDEDRCSLDFIPKPAFRQDTSAGQQPTSSQGLFLTDLKNGEIHPKKYRSFENVAQPLTARHREVGGAVQAMQTSGPLHPRPDSITAISPPKSHRNKFADETRPRGRPSISQRGSPGSGKTGTPVSLPMSPNSSLPNFGSSFGRKVDPQTDVCVELDHKSASSVATDVLKYLKKDKENVVTLGCEDSETGEIIARFNVNQFLLCARSPVFESLLRKLPGTERKTGFIPIRYTTPYILKNFLQVISTDDCELFQACLANRTGNMSQDIALIGNLFDLYKFGDCYAFSGLKDKCLKFAIPLVNESTVVHILDQVRAAPFSQAGVLREKCMSTLQNMRGADLMSLLWGEDLWSSIRTMRITVTFLCDRSSNPPLVLTAAPYDSVHWLLVQVTRSWKLQRGDLTDKMGNEPGDYTCRTEDLRKTEKLTSSMRSIVRAPSYGSTKVLPRVATQRTLRRIKLLFAATVLSTGKLLCDYGITDGSCVTAMDASFRALPANFDSGPPQNPPGKMHQRSSSSSSNSSIKSRYSSHSENGLQLLRPFAVANTLAVVTKQTQVSENGSTSIQKAFTSSVFQGTPKKIDTCEPLGEVDSIAEARAEAPSPQIDAGRHADSSHTGTSTDHIKHNEESPNSKQPGLGVKRENGDRRKRSRSGRKRKSP